MSEQIDTIHISKPTQLRIVAPNGDPLLTIHRDGRWEFRDEAAPTEAARVFFRELQRMADATTPAPAPAHPSEEVDRG